MDRLPVAASGRAHGQALLAYLQMPSVRVAAVIDTNADRARGSRPASAAAGATLTAEMGDIAAGHDRRAHDSPPEVARPLIDAASASWIEKLIGRRSRRPSKSPNRRRHHVS